MARPGEALVDVALAVLPGEARQAVARVVAHAVDTLAPVQAAGGGRVVLGGALVFLGFTLEACVGGGDTALELAFPKPQWKDFDWIFWFSSKRIYSVMTLL